MKLKNTTQQHTEITRWNHHWDRFTRVWKPRWFLCPHRLSVKEDSRVSEASWTSGNSSDCLLHQTTTSRHEQLGGNKRSGTTYLGMRMRMGRRAWLWTNLAHQMWGPGSAIEETKQNSDRMKSQHTNSRSSEKQGPKRILLVRRIEEIYKRMDDLCEWMDGQNHGCSFSLSGYTNNWLSPLVCLAIRSYSALWLFINNVMIYQA